MRRKGYGSGKLWLWFSIAGYLVFSLSFLVMGQYQLARYVPGILFWLGLIAGITGQVVLEKSRRSFFRRYGANYRKYQKRSCGALSVFSNMPARIADIAFPICLAGWILLELFPSRIALLRYLFLSLTVFSFCMHCVFNGRNYLFTNNHNRVRQVLEQEVIRNSKKERE